MRKSQLALAGLNRTRTANAPRIHFFLHPVCFPTSGPFRAFGGTSYGVLSRSSLAVRSRENSRPFSRDFIPFRQKSPAISHISPNFAFEFRQEIRSSAFPYF